MVVRFTREVARSVHFRGTIFIFCQYPILLLIKAWKNNGYFLGNDRYFRENNRYFLNCILLIIGLFKGEMPKRRGEDANFAIWIFIRCRIFTYIFIEFLMIIYREGGIEDYKTEKGKNRHLSVRDESMRQK